MKKIIIILSILFICYQSVIAQNKPTKGVVGIGLDYRLGKNVSIPSLNIAYYLNKDYSLKFSYTPSLKFNEFNSKTSVDEEDSQESYLSQYAMEIGLGLERHFLEKSKFDPFIGIKANYTFSSKGKNINKNQRAYYNESTEKNIININYSKDLSAGSNGFNTSLEIGANYFIIQNFSVGILFNLGYYMKFVDGTSIRVRETTYLEDGVIVSYNKKEIERKEKSTNQGFLYNASIKAAYYFNQ